MSTFCSSVNHRKSGANDDCNIQYHFHKELSRVSSCVAIVKYTYHIYESGVRNIK